MTTRPGRPSVPEPSTPEPSSGPSTPGPPAVRLRDPAGVVAAVPYLLGFPPSRSLVAIGVDASAGVGPTLRVDLDVAEAPDHEVAATWQHVQAVMSRNGCRHVLVVAFSDTDPGCLGPGRATTLVSLLRGGPGVRVLDVVHAGPARFRSLACEDPACCPETGSPRSDATSHPVAASFVLAGRSPVADREQTAPEDRTVTTAEATVARAAARATRAVAEPRRAAARPGTAADAEEQALFSLWAAGLPGCPDPADAGRLVAGWRAGTRLRDACLALFLPGGDQVAAALLRPDGDRGGEALARSLADPACAGVARDGDQVLRRLAALVEGEDRATVQAAHAWLSWVSGDGTAAAVLSERALAADARQPLATLVCRSLELGLGAPWTAPSPEQVRDPW